MLREQDWLTLDDPKFMLRFLTHHVVPVRAHELADAAIEVERQVRLISDRQCRLWCVAMVDRSTFDYNRKVYADWRDGLPEEGSETPDGALGSARKWINNYFDNQGDLPHAVRADLLRDIIGNPFRNPPSLTLYTGNEEIERLAQAAWDITVDQKGLPSSTLDHLRLAILADALEEAGHVDEPYVHCVQGHCETYQDSMVIHCICRHHALLAHLRSPAPHVRGCWALDLILNRGRQETATGKKGVKP